MIKKHWHEAALAYRGRLSSRQIAKLLSVGKSTVNNFFNNYDLKIIAEGVEAIEEASRVLAKHQQQVLEPVTTSEVKKGPRILVYDIETAPILAHMWSMWQQGFGLNQIDQDWFIMSFAAKWLGEDTIYYYDQRNAENVEDDSYILSKLWDLLNEADIVIGQNVKRFDTKKVNARFILNGYPKPSHYRQIDTMVIAKENFAFTSNKLEYLAANLCPEHVKSKHNKFPGHLLWSECLKGNIEAWQEMEDYNRDDILATEALYNVLSSWDGKLPNFDVYVDDVLDMSEWEHIGFVTSNLARYKLYRNKITGIQRRSRVNELSKAKRQSLLANVG